MKGDFTRSTYRADRHFRTVRMQQGRVQLDADWNEQVDLDLRRADASAADAIGAAGGSFAGDGFAIATRADELPEPQRAEAAALTLGAGDFLIGAGRYSVGGMACESEHPVRYAQQPDLPDAPLPAAGRHLVYLDVWEQHVTALEDPALREVALGGPDTATRSRLVWQVRLVPLPGVGDPAREAEVALAALTPATPGTLVARSQPTVPSEEPCLLTPGAGYQRLENQLYRVEIHAPARSPGSPGGGLGQATFKWSRDNGAVVTAWLGQSGTVLDVESSGRDDNLAIQVGDWVELTDDTRELRGEPGALVKVTAVSSHSLTIASADGIDRAAFPRNPRVRRWNTGGSAGDLPVEVPSANDGYLELEGGVQIRFGEGTYASGDYWLIPARSAIGDVLWPTPGQPLPAEGPLHRYAPLAAIDTDGTTVTRAADLRARFPALTELQALFAVGGDGQQAAPGQALAAPLEVGVAAGEWPVAGARVRFEVVEGSGLLEGTAGPLDLRTGLDGIASCRWTLGTDLTPQRVTATLRDPSGDPLHLPVHFHANQGTSSVDAAIRVTGVTLDDGTAVENDAEVPSHRLAAGLRVACDRPVAAESLSRATAGVALELPWPLTSADQALWGAAPVGFQPVALEARTAARAGEILWTPLAKARSWLETTLFTSLRSAGRGDPVLAWLRLRGDFIWARADPAVLLDGEVFGKPSGSPELPRIGGGLPSGDGRRGGLLELWFWLVDVTVSIALDAPEASPGAKIGVQVTVTGTVDPAVTVHASRGTITPGAEPGRFVYTAPKSILDLPDDLDRTQGIVQSGPLLDHAVITATSVVDPTRSASAQVRLLSLGRP